MIGTTEIIVIAVIILVLFGASAIPKFARSIGEAKKEFSKAAKEEEKEGAGKKDDTKKESDSK
jgi:sec-independent protein translocase protein TatA